MALPFTQIARNLFSLYRLDGTARQPGEGLARWGAEVEAMLLTLGAEALDIEYPYGFIMAENAGAGTPDAIEVTTDRAVPAADGGALIAVPILADNTTIGPTVSWDGGTTNYKFVSSSGNDVVAGGLKAGMIAWGTKEGSNFRLLSDQTSAALLMSTEQARDEALAAVPQLNFDSISDLRSFATGTVASRANVAGWYAGSREGGGEFKLDSTDVATADDSGTVIVDAVGRRWKRILRGKPLTAMMFGAVGDGLVEDRAACQLAIDSGHNIDWQDKAYACATALNFNQSGRSYVAQAGMEFIFTGASTARLAEISAGDITFAGVVFDGGMLQPRTGLVRVADDVVNLRVFNCVVRDILGTEWGSNVLNQTSGLSISPYGVTGLHISNSRFQNLRKHNDGTVFAAGEGLGFISGIEFGNEDGTGTATPQGIPTGGVLTNCQFDTIETILGVGLTDNEVATYDDAQGIRTISDENGSYSLDLRVANCTFRRCSKRAVKIRHTGAVCEGLTVWASDGAYRMSAVADVAHDDVLRGLTVYSTPELPVGTVVILTVIGEMATANNFTMIENIECEHCNAGVEVITQLPGRPFENVTMRNLKLPNVGVIGIAIAGAYAPSIMRNIHLENIDIKGSDTAVRALQWAMPDALGNVGLHIKNFRAINADVKIVGNDLHIDGLRIDVTSNTFAGYSAIQGLLEISGASGGTERNNIRGVVVNAQGINTAFINASRPWLVFLNLDDAKISDIAINVPEGLTGAYPHLDIGGTDTTISDLEYYGAGTVYFGVTNKALRMAITNAIRKGNGAPDNRAFVFCNNAANDDVLMRDIVDYRPVASNTIRIDAGVAGKSYDINGVRSRVTSGIIVQDGSALANQTNVAAF